MLGVMTFYASNFAMCTLKFDNFSVLINVTGITFRGENVELGQAVDRNVGIGMAGETFRKAGSVCFSMAGCALRHDICPGYAGSQGVES